MSQCTIQPGLFAGAFECIPRSGRTGFVQGGREGKPQLRGGDGVRNRPVTLCDGNVEVCKPVVQSVRLRAPCIATFQEGGRKVRQIEPLTAKAAAKMELARAGDHRFIEESMKRDEGIAANEVEKIEKCCMRRLTVALLTPCDAMDEDIVIAAHLGLPQYDFEAVLKIDGAPTHRYGTNRDQTVIAHIEAG